MATLRERVQAAGRQLPTLTLESEVRFASPEAQRAFATELTECIAGLVAKYHDEEAPRGRRFRVVLSGHPALPPERTGHAAIESPPEPPLDTPGDASIHRPTPSPMADQDPST